MKDIWITHFGAPEVILVDHGSAFTSDLFQHFVRDELVALLVYSGAGYPQGNSLNEAVHKGIESSLAVRRQYDTFSHYSDILRDTTLAYNSTPHSSLGVSPYFALFSKHMSLPGLQRFQERTSEEKQMATIYDIRKQAMQRAVMEADSRLQLYEPKSLTVGDDVVYHLQ